MKISNDITVDSHRPKEHEGALSFATDAWTSPNHRAYVAVTVHFETKGHPVGLLLDLVEVAKVRNIYHGVLMISSIEKIVHDEFDHSYKTDGAVGGDVEDTETSMQPSKVCFSKSCQ